MIEIVVTDDSKNDDSDSDPTIDRRAMPTEFFGNMPEFLAGYHVLSCAGYVPGSTERGFYPSAYCVGYTPDAREGHQYSTHRIVWQVEEHHWLLESGVYGYASLAAAEKAMFQRVLGQ